MAGSSTRSWYPVTARPTPLAAAHPAVRPESRPATAAGSPPASRSEGRNRFRAILAVPSIPQRMLRPNVITRLSPGHYRGMSALFRGPGVALLTLFHHDGSIDPGSTADLAGELVERGMRAVLVAGTTGEAATLTNAERSALIDAVRQAIPDGVPVIAGTGAPSIRQAAGLTEEAVTAGADAMLAWPPPGGVDLPGYFKAVAGAAQGRPVLAYHFPRVYAPGLGVEAVGGLAVAGVMDPAGAPDG